MDGQNRNTEDHTLDLPLFSNSKEIRVKHYALELKCDMECQIFQGRVVILCEPVLPLPDSCTRCLQAKHKNLSHTNTHTSMRQELTEKPKHLHSLDTWTQSDHQQSSHESINIYTNNAKEESHCGEREKDDRQYTYAPAVDLERGETDCTGAQSVDFNIILDSWDLYVEGVDELVYENSIKPTQIQSDHNYVTKSKPLSPDNCKYEAIDQMGRCGLQFENGKQYTKVWKTGSNCKCSFHRLVEIRYSTKPCGMSLKWTKDQDGNACVYTHGHWINNRSLFPSQDVPEALATWTARITAPEHLTVLMSGEYNAHITQADGMKTFHYHTDKEMPSSTLILAIGNWSQLDIITELSDGMYRCHDGTVTPCTFMLPCRLFSPTKLMDLSGEVIGCYIQRCLKEAAKLLGPHPFRRLDILIVPESFTSLGMANPSVMFLSQSVVLGGSEMFVRVAHELSHSWFGLLIGARDWHEEWLSEGFATYLENVIHTRAIGKSQKEFENERVIWDYLKYKILQAELENTGADLQTLGNVDACSSTNSDGTKYVKNGMNPDKGFMQLHYIKGYFLLRMLEGHCGPERFETFLKTLVATFRHKFITSEDVLELYFKMFTGLQSDTMCMETLLAKWIHCPGIPRDFTDVQKGLATCELVIETSKFVEQITKCSKALFKMHWRKRRKVELRSMLSMPSLQLSQILLLFDMLLSETTLHKDMLIFLHNEIVMHQQNPDVLHKWCELVIKYKVEQFYAEVDKFLRDHQAMGVYLYGELVISRDRKQRAVAEACYQHLAPCMDDGLSQTLHTMIYGYPMDKPSQ